ncbi:cytochrome P450 [Mycena olivaceomarginata]|nr:cytochrome P450 [Mycena olivaceomarginata]
MSLSGRRSVRDARSARASSSRVGLFSSAHRPISPYPSQSRPQHPGAGEDVDARLASFYLNSIRCVHTVLRVSGELHIAPPHQHRLCSGRDPEFLKLCINYAIVIFICWRIMSFFPKFLRPVFAPLISARKSTIWHALKFLGPIIDERLEQYNEHGRDWADKPSLTNALYDFVAYPGHFTAMREEAERVIAADGWTKAGLSNMHKIHSFFRELVRANSAPTNYENPNLFDGFRFSRLREQPAEGAATFNRHVISTATDFVPFGHGPHACPGRFFAVMQPKAMLAHILINYDMKAEQAVGDCERNMPRIWKKLMETPFEPSPRRSFCLHPSLFARSSRTRRRLRGGFLHGAAVSDSAPLRLFVGWPGTACSSARDSEYGVAALEAYEAHEVDMASHILKVVLTFPCKIRRTTPGPSVTDSVRKTLGAFRHSKQA